MKPSSTQGMIYGDWGGGAPPQYNPNDIKVSKGQRGPPEQIDTRGGRTMFNYNNETESEGESVLVSDTSSEISFSEEEY